MKFKWFKISFGANIHNISIRKCLMIWKAFGIGFLSLPMLLEAEEI